MLKKLPIGIQTFENLIKGDCLYIDKTKYIHELVKDVLIGNSSARYFLSRPRR
ncbi:MAG: AAA family ATPase, partial [Candidatus Margulisiibacteriota bacterium]